jgi:tetratricopeptide (TPR) repeat protein
MSDDISRQQALVLFERAHRLQMKGVLGEAMVLYKRSIAVFPTAEAFTFLGWTYSMLNRFDEAIDCCKKAIDIDPTFGNPYNDIGAYLLEKDRWEEAIPWLEQALTATRYDVPQFAHLNLGRAYEHLGRSRTALTCYDRALAIDPFYRNAIWARFDLLGRLN